MRTPKKYRRVKAAPLECYNYRGLTVAAYAGYPERPRRRLGIADAARAWRKNANNDRRVVISVNGRKFESGRCPRCGEVTNGSGAILDGQDAGDRERAYCPPCLKKHNKEARERAAIKTVKENL